MKFRKYEFLPSKWEELKVELQSSITIGEESQLFYNREIVESVVEIGHLTIIPQVLDEEMNVITESVQSDKFSVDILWQNDELESFAPYKIWCDPVGIHSFGASIDANYEEAYFEHLANN